MNILSERLRNNMRILNHTDIISEKLLGKTHRTGLLEFHPTDSCNLSCSYCTYKNSDKRITFPFSKLDTLSSMDPRGIVFAGGGEPTMYRDGHKSFSDLVMKIRDVLPGSKFGLITNGAHLPCGNWTDEFEWIRISVDFYDVDKFHDVKGGSLDAVMGNLLRYLQSSVPHVGVGFLVNNDSVSDVAEFVHHVYSYVKESIGVLFTGKLNIQIRLCCKIESCNCPSDNYSGLQDACSNLSGAWNTLIEDQKLAMKKWQDDLDFMGFVASNTNFDSFDVPPSGKDFERCNIGLVRAIIRADGNIYPCVMAASNDRASMGNIMTDTIGTITANQISNLSNCTCKSSCCEIDRLKNSILENGISSGNTSPDACEPFF